MRKKSFEGCSFSLKWQEAAGPWIMKVAKLGSLPSVDTASDFRKLRLTDNRQVPLHLMEDAECAHHVFESALCEPQEKALLYSIRSEMRPLLPCWDARNLALSRGDKYQGGGAILLQ